MYLRSFLKKNHEVCNLVSFASLMEIPLVEEGDCFFVSFKYGILDEFVFACINIYILVSIHWEHSKFVCFDMVMHESHARVDKHV